MIRSIIGLIFAALVVVGCMQPGYYPQQQPLFNNMPTYPVGPNQQMMSQQPQPLGVPFEAVVVTRYGSVIRHFAPVPNAYSNQAAESRRAVGETIAQSDYAAAAATTTTTPQTPGGTMQQGSASGGQSAGGATTNETQVLAQQQVQLHQRLRRVEQMHNINPTR